MLMGAYLPRSFQDSISKETKYRCLFYCFTIMKLLLLLLSQIISIISFAQSSKVKAYFVRPSEVNKIRRDTLQTVTSLKLTDTTYQIISFAFRYTVETFQGGESRLIKNEGPLFNEKILEQTKSRIRPGTTIVIDEIIIMNKEGKKEKVGMIFKNIY